MIAGRPIASSASFVERVARRGIRALDDRRWGVRLVDPLEQVAERLAILGHPDRLERRPEQADVVAIEDAGPGQVHRHVERGLAAEAGKETLGSLPGDDRLDRVDRERLEVDRVRDLGVGHDRGRVRVDEDRADSLGPERTARLRAGVVELGRLPDDHRPRADDQHRLGLHAATPGTLAGATESSHARICRRLVSRTTWVDGGSSASCRRIPGRRVFG